MKEIFIRFSKTLVSPKAKWKDMGTKQANKRLEV